MNNQNLMSRWLIDCLDRQSLDFKEGSRREEEDLGERKAAFMSQLAREGVADALLRVTCRYVAAMRHIMEKRCLVFRKVFDKVPNHAKDQGD